jgi:hypothetical protein
MKKDIMGFNEIKLLFGDFYNKVYTRWRVNGEKAGKDIVGEEYESFRKKYYISKGFTIGESTNIFDSGVNTDLVVLKNNKVVILEEDKGSYVDGTFLKRAIVDYAMVVSVCFEKNEYPPYFILSCPTKMSNFDTTYQKVINLFDINIKKEIEKKFIYLPLCDYGRVGRNVYYKTPENHFDLSETLFNKQEEIINKILNENGI